MANPTPPNKYYPPLREQPPDVVSAHYASFDLSYALRSRVEVLESTVKALEARIKALEG